MTVGVIGGGVIGLACAHYLRQAGHEVVVLERDRVGSGASRGNAGEICPDLVEPLPGPGVIAPALRTWHRPEAALHVRPSASLIRFLLGFTRHANRRDYLRGARALLALSAGTRELFEELDIDIRPNRNGFLFVFGSLAAARASRTRFRGLDAPVGEVLGPGELAEREPALAAGARAGFLVPDQWSIDPNRFVDGLVARLRADGVEIVEGARVTGLRERGGRVVIATSAGTVTADRAVIAAGVWSRAVCRSVGVDLGIVAGNGYSFAVPSARPPARLVHLGDAHVAVTPLDKHVRIAGTMAFDRDPDRFDPRRVAAIVAAARPYLSDVDWEARRQEWVGPRPMTPDGLPALGFLPGSRRIVVAAGHNMLGLMLAPATGRLVAGLVDGASAPAEFDPVRISRPAPRPV